LKIKKTILIFLSVFIIQNTYSQRFNFYIGSDNAFFRDFSETKMYFSGINLNAELFIKKFGWNFETNIFFPKTYYSNVSDLNSLINPVQKKIYVYVKGGGYSLGPGIQYKLYVSKEQNFTLQSNFNLIYYNNRMKYNYEPFIRIYGGYGYTDINAAFISYGLKSVIRFRNLRTMISIFHNSLLSQSKYDSFKISGFYEIKFGLVFPILYNTSSSKIIKINY